MDKYRSHLSLHRKYREAAVSKLTTTTTSTSTPITSTSTSTTTSSQEHQAKHASNNSHSHYNEASSYITASTASTSWDSASINGSKNGTTGNGNGHGNGNGNGHGITNSDETAEKETIQIQMKLQSNKNNPDSIDIDAHQNGNMSNSDYMQLGHLNSSRTSTPTPTSTSTSHHRTASRSKSRSRNSNSNGSNSNSMSKMSHIPFQPLGNNNSNNNNNSSVHPHRVPSRPKSRHNHNDTNGKGKFDSHKETPYQSLTTNSIPIPTSTTTSASTSTSTSSSNSKAKEKNKEFQEMKKNRQKNRSSTPLRTIYKSTASTQNQNLSHVQSGIPIGIPTGAEAHKIRKVPSFNMNTLPKVSAASSSSSIPEPSTSIPEPSASSSTSTSTQHPNQSSSHNTNCYMVPTEAQLRWAQFHRKKRALSVQQNLETLMSLPLREKDVDGVLRGDGDSTSTYSHCSDDSYSNSSTYSFESGSCSESGSGSGNTPSSTVKQRRKKKGKKKKFKLSRGRKALLRVSKRRTEKRRQKIQKHGFKMHPENDFDEEHLKDEHSHRTSNVGKLDTLMASTSQRIEDTFELDEITEALHVSLVDDSSFITERRLGGAETKSNGRDMGLMGSTILSAKKKKKSCTTTQTRKNVNSAKHLKGKRSMVSTADEDEERMKRFEEAYIAMCHVGDTKVGAEESDTVKTSKRWTRGTNVPVAVSIDGRIYDDLQRSPAFKDTPSSRRYAAQTYGAELNGKQLTDRVASWMMHLPKSTLRDSMIEASPSLRRKKTTMGGNDKDTVNEVVVTPQKLKLMELVNRLQGKDPTKSLHSFEEKKKFTPNDGPSRGSGNQPFKTMLDRAGLKEVVTSSTNKEAKKSLSSFNIGVNVAMLREKLFQSKNDDDDSFEEFDDEEIFDEYDDHNFDMVETLLSDDIENRIHNMAAHVKSSNSVIDTDMQSDISAECFEQRMQSLMLSPTIISKRLNQAIKAIESCQWDHVCYLVSANPWLAEMPDIRSDQYLLHKLAFHGAGNLAGADPAPEELHEEMLKVSPTSIHKFDSEGNLPLHLAAAAGNIDMMIRLSALFPGGASVKNNKGHLPLHMSLLAYSNGQSLEPEYYAQHLVKAILDLFPGALAIADNNGNLPVHLVASSLTGNIGAEVTHLLLEEAEKLGEELRFASEVRPLQDIDENMADFDVENMDEPTSIILVRNAMSWTPLMSAVKNRAGWQVLDAILSRDEIETIVFDTDENGKNILQLTLEEECYDPPSTLTILKFLPKLVTKPDFNGALPIETACIRELQQEIIMAIALIDLPIDLDADNNELDENRDEFGGSWWYLNCECDDAHTKIVQEILEICDYQQKRALCFAKNEKGRTLLRRATPKCKQELRKALRFVGRYEFIGSGAADAEDGPKLFEALDFGTDKDPIDDGQRVLLQYYGNEQTFAEATSVLQQTNLDDGMLVRMRFFHVDELESSNKSQNQFCIAIDDPILTLSKIIASMDRNKYRNDHERISRYINKLRKVFRMIGEGIYHLHHQGVVHGCIDTDSCGKFEDGWKVLNLIGSQYVGKPISSHRMGTSVPPEAVQITGRTNSISVRAQTSANASMDIWAFGKLMYEVLSGKQLLPVSGNNSINNNSDINDSHKMVIEEDKAFLRKLRNWNEDNLSFVVAEIEAVGVGTLAADLISHCLCPFPEHRPKNMKEVLAHPYWNELSKNGGQSSIGMRRVSSNGSGASAMKRRFQV